MKSRFTKKNGTNKCYHIFTEKLGLNDNDYYYLVHNQWNIDMTGSVAHSCNPAAGRSDIGLV